jgi:hypothetical protein
MAALAATEELVSLPLLADAATYSSCTFEYTSNASRYQASAPLCTVLRELHDMLMPPECHRDPNTPVTVNSWIEVFRKSTPTFKAHCLTDGSVAEAERQVRAPSLLYVCSRRPTLRLS